MAYYLHKAKELKFCANMPLKLVSVNAQYTNYSNEFRMHQAIPHSIKAEGEMRKKYVKLTLNTLSRII